MLLGTLSEYLFQGQEEFPTLLHLACKFGLEKLTMHLLDCPGVDVAYEIKNVNDLTPLEIAEANGYIELAIMLKGYIVSFYILLIVSFDFNLLLLHRI